MGTTSQNDDEERRTAPPTIPWCEPLDGFRAICVVLLIAAHTFLASSIIPFDGVLLMMLILVPLFFTISAFVLHQPFVLADVTRTPAPATGDFLARRMLRIYPLFLIALTMYLLLQPGLRPDNWWAITRLYLFLQIFGEELNDLKGIPAAWYLSNQVIFYLLMPIIASGIRRWSDRRGLESPAERLRPHLVVGWTLVLIGPFARTGLYLLDISYAPALPLAHLEFFGSGLVLASYAVGMRVGVAPPSFVRWFRANSTTSYILFLAPMFALAGVAFLFGDGTGRWSAGDVQDQLRFPLYLVAIMLIMIPATLGRRDDPTSRFLSHHRFEFVSALALHLYLWHQLVLGLMNDRMGGLDKVDLGGSFMTGLLLFAMALAGTMLVSWLSLPVTDHLYKRYRAGHGRSSERVTVGV